MTQTEQDLARQIAQHERWKWMRGMCAVTSAHPVDEFRVIYPKALRDGSELATCIPDIADPASQGCLWTALREEAAPVHVYDESHGIVVECHPGGDRERFTAPTLGEALARALLAAYGGER